MTPDSAGTSPSVGDLLGSISADLSTLMRQEVELAKAEAKQSAQRAGRAGGMFAGAGVAAHMFLLFLSIAVWWTLGEAIGRGWSALIVGLVWAIIAAILAVRGRAEMRTISGLPRTNESVKKIPQAVTGHEERA